MSLWVLLGRTNRADNQNMEASKNPLVILGNRFLEFALPPVVIAFAIAYVMMAVGIGWETTSGLMFALPPVVIAIAIAYVMMFIAIVIAFRVNIRERSSPE